MIAPISHVLTNMPQSACVMSGADAVACAAIDAGIVFASSYPGTPTTDIHEYVERYADGETLKTVWSVNEKVAYESSLGVAICGGRCLVTMKQVGLNVAADAFVNSCPAGVNGGLVLVVGDDPEIHSSPHKQDTRHYRALSQTILLEPADSQEAYDLTREAFRLSEHFQLPVILRLTMRTAYGCTRVNRSAVDDVNFRLKWNKAPERFFAIPTLARKLFVRLQEIQSQLAQAVERLSWAHFDGDDSLGIVTTGVGYAIAREVLPGDANILKVAGEPYPEDVLRQFVVRHRRLIVLEEGDPVLETRVRLLSSGKSEVLGRNSGHLKTVGELDLSAVRSLLRGERPVPKPKLAFDLPARIPEICKPCGYHKVFSALKELPNIATPSDIGCNTLGGLPPYSVMDGVWAMGSSIGVACGLAAIKTERILAIIGDSTFFHAGIAPLIEAVHQQYKLTILLLDNGTAAMTGGQAVPHRPSTQLQHRVDLATVINACGASCTPFDPHKLGVAGIRELVESSFAQPGVKVLLYRSQCGLHTPGYFTEAPHSLRKG